MTGVGHFPDSDVCESESTKYDVYTRYGKRKLGMLLTRGSEMPHSDASNEGTSHQNEGKIRSDTA